MVCQRVNGSTLGLWSLSLKAYSKLFVLTLPHRFCIDMLFGCEGCAELILL
jgi:hypothetical protein